MSDIFPRWTNRLPGQVIFGLLVVGTAVAAGVYYYMTPKYVRVGYKPVQPVAFSHAIHAGQLGIDCRYCHDAVEKSWYSNVPATDTCINCHSQVLASARRIDRELGPADRHRFREYLNAIDETEQRLKRAGHWLKHPKPSAGESVSVGNGKRKRRGKGGGGGSGGDKRLDGMRITFDLLALALQTRQPWVAL